MKKRFWMAAAACFVLAAVCILLPSPWGWLRTTLTILSVPLLVGGMLLVVNALLPAHVLPVLGLDEPEHGSGARTPAAQPAAESAGGAAGAGQPAGCGSRHGGHGQHLQPASHAGLAV